MGSYYSHLAGPALKEKLAELSGLTSDERLALDDEIDMARVLTERSVRIFEATCLNGNDVKPELRTLAIQQLRSSLGFVTETVQKAAKTRALNEGLVGLQDLDYVLGQVIKIADRVFGHLVGTDAMTDFANDVRSVRLPERGTIAEPEDRAAKIRQFLEAARESDALVDPDAD